MLPNAITSIEVSNHPILTGFLSAPPQSDHASSRPNPQLLDPPRDQSSAGRPGRGRLHITNHLCLKEHRSLFNTEDYSDIDL